MLGIVPMGTANDFATGLGIPEDPWEAMQLAIHDTARPIDVGTVNDEVCTAGAYYRWESGALDNWSLATGGSSCDCGRVLAYMCTWAGVHQCRHWWIWHRADGEDRRGLEGQAGGRCLFHHRCLQPLLSLALQCEAGAQGSQYGLACTIAESAVSPRLADTGPLAVCSHARPAAGGIACSRSALNDGHGRAGLTNFNAITSKKASIKGPVHRTVHKGDNAWQVR